VTPQERSCGVTDVFDRWPHPIGSYTEETTFDVSAMAQYREARQKSGLAVTDPIVNPDTGYPVISMSYRFASTAALSVPPRPTSR